MNLPRIAPMLAVSGDRPDLNRAGHLFEPKWDGTRAIGYIEHSELRLVNRRNLGIAHRYPELADVPRHVHAESAILDGEVVVLDERGRPHFEATQLRDHLQHRAKISLRADQYPATYVVFDLLALNGTSHLGEPLRERKALLAKVVEDSPRIVKTLSTPAGEALFEEIVRRGWEGVMAKAVASPYLPGRRSRHWLKIKALQTQSFVLIGYLPGEGRRALGALCLGLFLGGELHYVGNVGTGWTDEVSAKLLAQLDRLRQAACPVVNPPETGATRDARWVEPRLVCEVRFLEFTKGHSLRAAAFRGLRRDVTVESCVLE